MHLRTSQQYTTAGAHYSADLRQRAPEISIAFGQAVSKFLSDNNILFKELERAKLSIAVNTETPKVTHPLSATLIQQHGRPSEIRFISSLEGYILYSLLYHNMASSRATVFHAELKLDDKKPSMAAPTKRLEIKFEAH
ncbi:MAG: hypothetical protein GC136_05700 [Alphaproteobacteria bacterium]|nr:hypothetical protein [Alphaproteobacteria bacterium]